MAKYYHVVLRRPTTGIVNVVAKDEKDAADKAQELMYMGRVHMSEDDVSAEVREMEANNLHIYEKLKLDCKNLFFTWKDRVLDYEFGRKIGAEQDELQVELELSEMRGIFSAIVSFTGHQDFGANVLALFGAYTSQDEVTIEESNELLDMIDKEFYALSADSGPDRKEKPKKTPKARQSTLEMRNLCGRLLKAYRERNSLTQEQLGKRLGVRKERISKWEREESAPKHSLRKKIEKELGVKLEKGFDACLKSMKSRKERKNARKD